MNTSNYKYSRKTVGIACGLLFIAYMYGYHKLISYGQRPQVISTHQSTLQGKYASNIDSRHRTYKTIKSIKVIPSTETYEVSEWVTSGDWSHDNYPLTVTIPTQMVIMDVDYVEDHWDDYINDPEDELQYPPDIFQ